jgi:hypothetical protein
MIAKVTHQSKHGSVDGRMSYRQFGTLVGFTLFLCVPVTLIVVASVQDGRSLNSLGSVIGFLAGFLTAIWVVSVLGVTSSVRGVAQRVAQVVEATGSNA